jgi:hypothetical protein
MIICTSLERQRCILRDGKVIRNNVRNTLRLRVVLMIVYACTQQPMSLDASSAQPTYPPAPPAPVIVTSNDDLTQRPADHTPSSQWAPAHMCTIAVFRVIETKMNRTQTVSIPLGTSIRYNTIIIQPQSCTMQSYAGDHHNTTVRAHIWGLPYRVMHEPNLVDMFPPTLLFSGLMSTISPTFEHPNYAIIPVGCQTVPCR